MVFFLKITILHIAKSFSLSITITLHLVILVSTEDSIIFVLLQQPRYLMFYPFIHHYECYIALSSSSLLFFLAPLQLVLTKSKELNLHILTFANQCVLGKACVVLTMMYSVIKVPGVYLITAYRHSITSWSQDNLRRLFLLRHDSIAYQFSSVQ